MYTIKKNGALFQVISVSGIVQFSSLDRANCKRWVAQVQETQEEKENSFLINES